MKLHQFHSFRNATHIKTNSRLPDRQKKKLLDKMFLDTVGTHYLSIHRIKQICSIAAREQTIPFRIIRNMQVGF